MELQELYSTYSQDTKYFNDAKRSVKDIPESKALQIFNECFSVANRENSKISAFIRQGKFERLFPMLIVQLKKPTHGQCPALKLLNLKILQMSK